MPGWLYQLPTFAIAIVMVGGISVISLIGLTLVRRRVLPHFRYHDGVNDAVAGTVQAIGVFYGVTVGLIAVGVWNNYANALDIASREAVAVGALNSDVTGLPEPIRTELGLQLRDYLVTVVEQVWPAQRLGHVNDADQGIIRHIRDTLMAFEPQTEGQKLRYAEALAEFGRLIDLRRLRIDSVDNGLSPVMWWVIWVGASISIGVGCLFKIDDGRLHAALVMLMAGFLGIVLFMIAINDKPFVGTVSVTPNSYQLMLDSVFK